MLEALAFVDWMVIAFCLVIFVGTGLYFGKNDSSQTSKLSGFFLGGRNLPWYVAGLSMVATTFAADTPLAVAELVAKNGIAGNWLWWSFLAGGLFTTFFFAHLWRRAQILTELEFITLRYGGKPAAYLRQFKALYLGVFLNLLVIGWVNVAMISLLQTFFSLNEVESLLAVAAIIALSVVYTAKSGLRGIAIADGVQFVFAMVGCVVLAYFVLDHESVGGVAGLQAKLPSTFFDYLPSFNASSSSNFTLTIGAFFAFIGVQWWASWYPGQEPGGGGYISQRMMSAKNEQHAFFATLFFQFAHYCLRPWPWIIVGLAAVALYHPEFAPADANPQQIEAYAENQRLGFVFTMTDFLPVGLKGFLLVAFIAAYMSTMSTQLNWGASYVINDLFKAIYPTTTENNLVKAGQWVTLGLSIAGLAITGLMDSISGVWEFILECGAGLGLVLILRWYWWRINAYAEITATLAPFVGYTIGHYLLADWLGDDFINQKGTYLFTVVFTTLSWLAVMYSTKPETESTLSEFYQKTRPSGWWKNFSKQDANVNNSAIKWRIAAWLSSIICLYCLLVATGEIIFGHYVQAITLLAITGGSGFICWLGIQKIAKA